MWHENPLVLSAWNNPSDWDPSEDLLDVMTMMRGLKFCLEKKKIIENTKSYTNLIVFHFLKAIEPLQSFLRLSSWDFSTSIIQANQDRITQLSYSSLHLLRHKILNKKPLHWWNCELLIVVSLDVCACVCGSIQTKLSQCFIASPLWQERPRYPINKGG